MRIPALRGEILLLLATLLAAVGWIASKRIILEVPGETFITARFLLASLILLPFCYQRILTLTLKQVASVCAVGLILAASVQVWVHAVFISNTLAEGAFIMSLAMIIAPITSWLLFQIRPNRAFWIALPIAISGMTLLTLANGWQVEPSQWYFLLASALLSLHFVFNKKILTSINPLTSICLQLFMVGISGAFSVLLTSPEAFEINRDIIFWFAISTVIATVLRYLMQTIGQFSVKIETASLIMILEPIWTLILSMSVLGEVIETQKLIGGGIIFLSLFVYIKLSKR
ncbi:EamA family transporter [Shewanella sp. Choline-02u-19]|uniref:DMT family transporter n=2 Tax=Shewanella TaxID=22 RepID=UPI000C32240C|nr:MULTISPECIES: EamA family transporter [unclassified Shewanella]PKG59099.1 EamA family transporter [Shewanella sp. GutDb-MelDb]PKH54527.1 EamA family transporter [Shewanella sp. Bg11-22]PKI28585.1 EamA family transporter [Shewanella sp. Choline-02u-19]